MKSLKGQKIITENHLREIIRKGLREGTLNELSDDYGTYSMGGLIDAWRPFFDSLSISGQVILSNVLTQLRLFTTFNSRKAEQIVDRQRDRNANFKQQLDSIDMPIGPDIWIPAFVFNPGVFIAAATAEKGLEAAGDTVDWLKGAGVGDWAIDELEPGGAVAKRKREEEESGPVAKLLRSLEDIFLLRMGAEDQGNLLAEAKGDSAGDFLTSEILGGSYGSDIQAMQQELIQSLEEIEIEIEQAQIQIDFLKSVTNIDSIESLEAQVANLQRMQPDADLGDIQNLPAQLRKDTEEMMKDEDAKRETAKSILQTDGIEDPTEEEILRVSDNDIKSRFEDIAFESAVDGFKKGAGEQIASIQKIYSDLSNEIFPPLKGITADVMNSSPYGKAVETIKNKISSLG